MPSRRERKTTESACLAAAALRASPLTPATYAEQAANGVCFFGDNLGAYLTSSICLTGRAKLSVGATASGWPVGPDVFNVNITGCAELGRVKVF